MAVVSALLFVLFVLCYCCCVFRGRGATWSTALYRTSVLWTPDRKTCCGNASPGVGEPRAAALASPPTPGCCPLLRQTSSPVLAGPALRPAPFTKREKIEKKHIAKAREAREKRERRVKNKSHFKSACQPYQKRYQKRLRKHTARPLFITCHPSYHLPSSLLSLETRCPSICVCIVSTFSSVWINRVWLLILLVVR